MDDRFQVGDEVEVVEAHRSVVAGDLGQVVKQEIGAFTRRMRIHVQYESGRKISYYLTPSIARDTGSLVASHYLKKVDTNIWDELELQ